MIETLSSPRPVIAPPFPSPAARVPAGEIAEGSYRVRFARSLADLDALLRLRFAVFNLELGEGLDSSFATGRDEDEYDLACHHLLVEERESGRVVGTYRLQTAAMAAAWRGFYTASEYDLGWLPPEIRASSLEVGRACVAPEHRGRQVLYLLWKGLAVYLEENGLRYLFGCCSLTSQEPRDGHQALRQLQRRGVLHPELWIPTLPEYDCGSPPAPEEEGDEPAEIALPALFEMYLRYAGKVASPPALDRRFKTIDFLVLLDTLDLSPRARKLFFGSGGSRG